MPISLSPSQLNYADTAQWKLVIKQALADTRCATPAFLVNDLSASQTVTVQIAIQERVRTATAQQWWDIPPITNVPIVTPRGGGYSITLPLKKGDQGLLVFCDTCFDNWWVNGQSNAPPAQNTGQVSGSQRQFEVRRHHVHDCGFLPGMWSQNNLLTNYSTTSLQIRSDDGATVIDVSENGVEITAGAVSAKSTGGTPQALMNDTFFQWYMKNIQPFLVSKGYAGPAIPLNCETTILKGQ